MTSDVDQKSLMRVSWKERNQECSIYQQRDNLRAKLSTEKGLNRDTRAGCVVRQAGENPLGTSHVMNAICLDRDVRLDLINLHGCFLLPC